MTTNLKKPSVPYVDADVLNDVVEAMISNDKKIRPQSSVSPNVWKCSWYNVQLKTEYQKQIYCYQRGDAVWLNTEDVDQFVQANYSYIESVVMANGELRRMYEELDGDKADIVDFFKKVTSGEVTGNSDGLPLFCIGDMTQPVQIRVSLSSNNDHLPTDDGWWKDFFVDAAEGAELSILECADRLLEQYMDRHLREYHLSGLAGALYDEQSQTQLQLDDICLRNTLSNVTGEQYYGKSGAKSATKGFDWVVRYFHKRFNSGQTCKWFRVWNSGLVEQGGIVKNNSACATAMGDSLAYANGNAVPTCYKVNLSWSAEGVSAPAFKYATLASGFYYEDSEIDLGDGYAMRIQDDSRAIAPGDRYTVQLTPVSTASAPYNVMCPTNNMRSGYYYVTKEVFGMTNSSFCFVMTQGHDYYSYYVTGFVPNVQLEYK